jgi:hypothetical protein
MATIQVFHSETCNLYYKEFCKMNMPGWFLGAERDSAVDTCCLNIPGVLNGCKF